MKKLLFLLVLFPLFVKGQIITTVAGNGKWGATEGDGGPATAACMNQPLAVAVDDSGNVYIVDVGNDNIRKVAANGIISNIAGNRMGGNNTDVAYGAVTDERAATNCKVWKPHGIVTDHAGNVYFSEQENGTIRKISAGGIIITIAGIPGRQGYGYYGDNTSATANMLNKPNGIAIDNGGNIYFAEEGNNMVREILTDGNIVTIAGTGYAGYSGDGGPATAAQLNMPWGVTVDPVGNIYIADTKNNVVRKINAAGIISTFAGTGEHDYNGDGGLAVKAELDGPMGIAADRYGNVYIADSRNDAVRRVSSDGVISTFAGNGRRQYHGDDEVISSVTYSRDRGTVTEGCPATAAQLFLPTDVAVDKDGNVYIADDHNHVVEKVTVPQQVRKIPKKENPIEIPKGENPNSKVGNQKGSLSPSDTFTITADPENDMLIIATDPAAFTSFAITDMAGNTLIQQAITMRQTQADISMLQPARYYINLKKGDKIKTAMFVKDK